MYYSAQNKTSPSKTGIIFMICGIIIGLITLFIQLLLSGRIVLSGEQVITIVSIFSGLLTDVIILCCTVPKFHLALHSQKVIGKIIDIEEGEATYKTSSGFLRHCTIYTPVVEYTVENEKVSGIKLTSTSTSKPVIGDSVHLRVSNSDFKKIIDLKQLVFLIFATVLFLLLGSLFALPGIIYLVKGNLNSFAVSTVSPSGDASYAFMSKMIGGGFALLFFLIGLIVFIKSNSKNSKKALIETGIKNSCRVTEVNVNTNTYINGCYPVKITCQNSSGLLFYAKTIADPDTYSRDQSIDVYTDPENPEKYYVDLDSVR